MRAGICSSFLLLSAALFSALPEVCESVDALVGGSCRGHTFPGATCPFSMVQTGPGNGHCSRDHFSGHVREDPYVYGFSHTHLSGAGCPDLADVRLLPFSGDFTEPDPANWELPKDFRAEKGPKLKHADLVADGELVFEMTHKPAPNPFQ